MAIKTKILTLKVTCENCEPLPFVLFLPNHEQLICDICGKINQRVSFEEA